MLLLLIERHSKDNAGKRLGETRTYALLPQPETGKISCVHHLSCARLTPGTSEPMPLLHPLFLSGWTSFSLRVMGVDPIPLQ